ncbi:hypothetical protein RSAG8_06423, partial [Rhizoctonia solani AG-8 WAC10335]
MRSSRDVCRRLIAYIYPSLVLCTTRNTLLFLPPQCPPSLHLQQPRLRLSLLRSYSRWLVRRPSLQADTRYQSINRSVPLPHGLYSHFCIVSRHAARYPGSL